MTDKPSDEAPGAGGPAATGDAADGLAKRLLRGAALITGGTLLGHMVVLAVTPILSRLYAPSAFGLLGLYAGTLSFVLAGSSLRYEAAVPVAESDGDAVSLAWLSFGVTAIIAGAVGVGLAILCLAGGTGRDLAVSPVLLLALPLGILGGGAYQTLSNVAIRWRAYEQVSGTKVYQGAANAGIQVVLGLLGVPSGLVWGDLAGRSAGVGSLGRLLRTHGPPSRIRLLELRRLGHKYRRYPVILLPAALCSMAAVQAPIILIPLMFGLSAGGAFFLAHRLLVLPGSLISSAVAQVFLGEASQVPRGEQLRSLTMRAAEVLFLVNTPFYVVVAIGGPELFALFLGPEWARAGRYAAILAPMMLVWSVANPLSRLAIVADKLGDSLAFAALELTVKLGAIGIGLWLHSLLSAVVALSILGGLLALGSLFRFGAIGGVSVGGVIGACLRGGVVPCAVLFAAAAAGSGAPFAVRGILMGLGLCVTSVFGWLRMRAAVDS